MISRKSYYFLILCVILSFSVLVYRLFIVANSDYVDGVDLQAMEQNIKDKTENLPSERGKILDADGNVLAETTLVYKIVAYVDPKRSIDTTEQVHVSNVEHTAEVIAQVIGDDPSAIAETLTNAIQNGKYQTYLGRKASNINVSQRSEIEKYNLPGIDFEAIESRSYPFGNFASYQIGYAKNNEVVDENGNVTNVLKGEMGVEKSYSNYLEGKDGKRNFVSDAVGVRIPNTPEEIIEPVNGSNVYLTIEKDIQLILETAIKNISSTYNPETALIVVADAKTGAILGVSSSPSFNPNVRDIKDYVNPLHEQLVEPGSTMKTFTYAKAVDDGVYDPNYMYNSGSFTVYDRTIRDWNDRGFGRISLELAYIKSANTGSSIIAYEFLGKEKMQENLVKLGFGKPTGFDLPGEVSGKIDLTYDIDVVTASFGQGISVTPIQMIQALTVFANQGSTLKPYIVDRIEDSSGNVVLKNERTVSNENVYSNETTEYIKNMMQIYLDSPEALTKSYSHPQYGLIGKTGTSQIAKDGKYLTGGNDFTFSFSGMMPKEDPEVIIYGFVRKPEYGESATINQLIREVVPKIAEIHGINVVDATSAIQSTTSFMSKYTGMNITKAKEFQNANNPSELIVIGTGDNVIAQYPKPGDILNSYSKTYFLTDSEQTIPNFTGMNYRDVAVICNLLDIKLTVKGIGNVVAQSSVPGTNVNEVDSIVIELQ